jgi:catechol 2,3-dioxygenase-like lactoylglutathione lyase family enzyme
MTPTINGYHHVKLPVSDVRRSRDWYQRVLGLHIGIEFVEADELMGVALRDDDNTIDLALRQDPARAVALAGFDPLALCVPEPAALAAWQQRLADLGESHHGIVEGHAGQVLVGLHDPDGIEIRLYCPATSATHPST